MHHPQYVVGLIAVAVALRIGNAAATTSMNHAPSIPCGDIYRTYPGFPIRIPGGGSDPDGNALQYSATSLPDGAQLDPGTGVFTWTPAPPQIGPFYLPLTVTDDGVPPQSADGVLMFKVSPSDACTQPNCDPATGCTSTMVPLTQPCCADQPSDRVAEPMAGCPQGRVLFIGRNENFGFGRLQNCDRLRLITFGQVGQPSIRLNLQVRCLNLREPMTVHASMESSLANRGVVLNLAGQVRFSVAEAGFAEALVNFPLVANGPFFDFEDSEALLIVDVTDIDGATVYEQVRLKLTSLAVGPLADLPDIDTTGPTPPVRPCGLAPATPTSSASRTPSTTSTPLPTDTATPTESVTPSNTPTASPTATASLTATAIINPTPSSTKTPLAGDCDGSGGLTESDLLTLMEIALGHTGRATCAAPPREVTVVEMLTVVSNARTGGGATSTIR